MIMKFSLASIVKLALFSFAFRVEAASALPIVDVSDILICETEIAGNPVSVRIQNSGGPLLSFITGTAMSPLEPVSTTRDVYTSTEAQTVLGVKPIWRALGKSEADLGQVLDVVTYTAGQMDDDASGFRVVEFRDEHEGIIGRGAYLGWAGAGRCR